MENINLISCFQTIDLEYFYSKRGFIWGFEVSTQKRSILDLIVFHFLSRKTHSLPDSRQTNTNIDIGH